MASTPRAFIGWKALAAALAAAGCLGSPALAAPEWVRNALSLGRDSQLHATPTVARFIIQEGGAFVLDRSRNPALLKFDDSSEIWAVQSSRGPRGDILFKDDVGDTLLRATKLGGMTVFTERRPEGSAAALVGASTPLKIIPMGAAGLYQRLVLASLHCTHAAHHLVSFEVPDADAHSAPVIGDAISLAAEAIITLAGRPSGRAATARVDKVVVTTGARPAALFQRGALVIVVVPAQGLAGHPSSVRIEQAIVGG
ncbi:MAG TPA: DUF4908 domain-containing protein [Caulobacteraceae bacterium]|jgi:hypothetical protein